MIIFKYSVIYKTRPRYLNFDPVYLSGRALNRKILENFLKNQLSRRNLAMQVACSLILQCSVIRNILSLYIYINLPDMSQLMTSAFPKRGHQGPETFLALSADKQTGEGDIKGATEVLRESPKWSN